MSPPDMAEVPPPVAAASSTRTSASCSAASTAVQAPAQPSPTTTTSASRSQLLTSSASIGAMGSIVMGRQSSGGTAPQRVTGSSDAPYRAPADDAVEPLRAHGASGRGERVGLD